MSPGRILFLTALMIASTLSLPTSAQENSRSSDTASNILFEKAGKLDMFALGESHWSLPEHRFLRELILDPRFPTVFPTIIVEFGNARHQRTLDRYLAGEKVSSRDLRMVWQDTTMPRAWDSPLYAEFFETVREVNKRLPKIKKLRVFLGDPPVDWSKVKGVADFKPFMDRDAFYAGVMARNCGRGRCLLICGGEHFHWKDPLANLHPPSVHKNALEYYRIKVGNAKKIEAVLPLYSHAEVFAQYSAPALLYTHAPPLSTLRFGQVDQDPVMILKEVGGETKPVEVRADDTLPLSDVVDWVLYLGKSDEQSEPPPSLYQDGAYVRELYRRAKIVGDAFGFDLSAEIREIDPDAKH
jgi:hypothetical protein